MYKVTIVLAFLLLVCIKPNFAQDDFRKGYIIKNNNDTIPRLVFFQKNNSMCKFKFFDIAIPITYSPESIKEYGIYNISAFRTVDYKSEKVFATYLVKGSYNLVYYKKAKQFYVTDNNGNICILSDNEIEFNDKKYSDYKALLNDLIKNKNTLTEKINTSKPDQENLTDIFVSYHKQNDISYKRFYETKPESFLKRFSVSNISVLHFFSK